MEALALLLAATLNAGTVLAIAALGLLINERAGILNLGAEGMMLVAAIAGFATCATTGNDWLAFGAGMVAGALMAGAFGLLVIWLNTNQYASGLALSLFGAGFSARGALWTALMLSGGTAGLAGALEAAGPLGQLTPHVPAGYGFAAIIVAFVGRLHPVGMVFSAILMSMFYIGGELAQTRMGLPKSLTGVFQGLLLFTLLACDTLIHYRIRWQAAHPAAPRPLPPPLPTTTKEA